jgi:hypothetical protein
MRGCALNSVWSRNCPAVPPSREGEGRASGTFCSFGMRSRPRSTLTSHTSIWCSVTTESLHP